MRTACNTASQADPLGLWGEHGLDDGRVRDFLALDKKAFGKAVEGSSQGVNCPVQRNVLLEQIAELCNQVAAHFGGDAHKSGLWFRTPNPMLGDLSPREMIRLGRYRRLRQFVLRADEEV